MRLRNMFVGSAILLALAAPSVGRSDDSSDADRTARQSEEVQGSARTGNDDVTSDSQRDENAGSRQNQSSRQNQDATRDRQSVGRANSSQQNDQSRDRRSGQQGQGQQDDNGSHAGLGVQLSESRGRVLVKSVAPQSPAAEAGLQTGDELVSIDDQRVQSADEVVDEIRDKDPGARISLTVRRNGEERELRARLESRREAFAHQGNRQQNGQQQSGQQLSRNDNRGGNRAWSYENDDQGQNSGQYGRGQRIQEQRTRRMNDRDENQQSSWNNGQDQNLGRQVQALQQQVSQLRQEVQQLRNQNSRSGDSSDDRRSSSSDRLNRTGQDSDRD